MPLVTVLATGGTITSRADPRGGATAQDSGAARLVASWDQNERDVEALCTMLRRL